MYNPKSGSGTRAVTITLHSYVVEFPAPGGERVRLEVEQHLETIDVAIGSDVPLLVSPDGKQAVFDHKDPSINVVAVEKAQQEADRARFREQLENDAGQ